MEINYICRKENPKYSDPKKKNHIWYSQLVFLNVFLLFIALVYRCEQQYDHIRTAKLHFLSLLLLPFVSVFLFILFVEALLSWVALYKQSFTYLLVATKRLKCNFLVKWQGIFALTLHICNYHFRQSQHELPTAVRLMSQVLWVLIITLYQSAMNMMNIF